MKVIDDLYCDLVEIADFATTSEDLEIVPTDRVLELDGYIELARLVVEYLEKEYIQREQ